MQQEEFGRRGLANVQIRAMLPCLLLLLLNSERADSSYSLRQSRFRVFTCVAACLWHRRDCLVEKQPAVESLVFA